MEAEEQQKNSEGMGTRSGHGGRCRTTNLWLFCNWVEFVRCCTGLAGGHITNWLVDKDLFCCCCCVAWDSQGDGITWQRHLGRHAK